MIVLSDLTPAAQMGWWTLFDLAAEGADDWLLIGGQMMHVVATEHGFADRIRPTVDVDVVVDVRARPGGTERLARWLVARGFEFEGHSGDGIGHRFSRRVGDEAGRTIFDVLAPEGLGSASDTTTMPPTRTVEVPGATQAFDRSRVLEVSVDGLLDRVVRAGIVRCPDLLGALVLKAAATSIAVRENPDRDWQDAALLLAMMSDPIAASAACTRKDRQRLRQVAPLNDRDHVGWRPLDDDAYTRGVTSLAFLTGS